MHAPGTHTPEAQPFAGLSIQAGAAEHLEGCGATGPEGPDYRTRELTRALQTYIGLRTGGAA